MYKRQGLSFIVRLAVPEGASADAVVVLLGATVYLCAGLAALRMPTDLLGPDPAELRTSVRTALSETFAGLAAGLRHLMERRVAARALASMTLMRFCYGALTVMVLMLCRYAWAKSEADGLALLGLAVGVSGAGFFVAAVFTPWAASRFGRLGWMAVCAASAAVLEPALGLTFEPVPILIAAFVLGLTTQGAKIATDTVVQSAVDDAFRGRIFSLYDVLFNIAFVGAAGVAALMLPSDGRSVTLVVTVAAIYAATALALAVSRRQPQ